MRSLFWRDAVVTMWEGVFRDARIFQVEFAATRIYGVTVYYPNGAKEGTAFKIIFNVRRVHSRPGSSKAPLANRRTVSVLDGK